jgi:hypothetical protein
LAQPDPLKTMFGDETILRSAPPQTSQVVGRGAWIPCTTSTCRPQEVQT